MRKINRACYAFLNVVFDRYAPTTICLLMLVVVLAVLFGD